MFDIVEKQVHIDLPLGHQLHCMICQIPNRLGVSDYVCRLADPEDKWQQIRSVLELIAEGRVSIEGRQVQIANAARAENVLINPPL